MYTTKFLQKILCYNHFNTICASTFVV